MDRVAVVVDDLIDDADFAYLRPGVVSVRVGDLLPGARLVLAYVAALEHRVLFTSLGLLSLATPCHLSVVMA
jgi:hypothetical protein